MKRTILTLGLMAMLLMGGRAQATLIDRGANMVYDDALNITWTRQAGDGVARNWADSNTWAAGLTVDGFTGWRLATMSLTSPTTSVFDCSTGTAAACAASGNELGYMFYHILGGTLGGDRPATRRR